MNEPWNDTRNYKHCREKDFETYVCVPPIGSVIINNKNKQLYNAFGKRVALSLADIRRLSRERQMQLVELIKARRVLRIQYNWEFVYVYNDGNLVVSDGKELERYAQFLEGESRTFSEGVDEFSCDNLMNWHRIEVSSRNLDKCAYQVPSNVHGVINLFGRQVYVNGHNGVGDFIVLNYGLLSQGRSRVPDVQIMSAGEFGTTHDNRGWSDNLPKFNPIKKEQLPDFFRDLTMDDFAPSIPEARGLKCMYADDGIYSHMAK